MIEKFKIKPIKEEVYEAIKYTGDNKQEIIDFIKNATNFKIIGDEIICMVNDHIGWFLHELDYVVKFPDDSFSVKTWEEVNYKSIKLY